MSGSGGRPPGRTLPPPFSPPGARPGAPAPAQPAPAEPSPSSTSPGHAPAPPAGPPRSPPRPSQPPPMGAPSAAPPITTQPLPSPPPPASPRGPSTGVTGPGHAQPIPTRPPSAAATQIGPGFTGGAHAPQGQPAYRPPPAPTAPAPPPAAAPAAAPAASFPPPPPAYPPPPTAGGAGFAPGGGFPPPPGGDPAFMQGLPPPGSGTDSVVAMPGGKFAGLIEMSARRAFRLRIEPEEVLPNERAALELAQPPITDKNLQAFLAWRRSVLLVVATILVPLSILRLIDSLRGPSAPAMFRAYGVLPALAEAAFCGICIWQLSKWTQWRQQRKMIFLGWVVFMATPFVIWLYPMAKALGVGSEGEAGVGLAASIVALLSLAPKAISLMPGVVRAALVSKMLFPGSAGAGWLIVLAAPIYALFAFVLLILPYQITGSGWFLLAMIGFIGAQVILTRAGYLLAQPSNQAVAIDQVKRVRSTYLIVIGVAALFLVIALFKLVKTFQIGYLTVFTTVLSFEANVLILTMIGSDLVITNLDRARALQQGTAKEVEDTNLKLAAFVGGSEPPAPPPFR